MAKWFDNQVDIEGAVATVMFDDLDRILSVEWRLASWLPRDAYAMIREDGSKTWTRLMSGMTVPPGVEVAWGGWDHDHCCVTFCADYLSASDTIERRIGYVTAYENGDEWLCRQCGEAVLKWRETDECRAYMERRSAGLPGPPPGGDSA